MHLPGPSSDARLRHVPAERWERARLLRERGWLRDAHLSGTLASGTCMGLVGVRPRIDLATLASRCDCGQPQPCEHALALLLAFVPEAPEPLAPPPAASVAPPPAPPEPESEPEPEPPAPPAPRREATALSIALDPTNPGRLLLSGADGFVPERAAEALRWLWWRRLDAERFAGEPRTLAQTCQLLVERGLRVASPAESADLRGGEALFHQRALGEAVQVRIFDARSDAGLALAHLLADRGAHPFAGPLPAEYWSVGDEVGFASFFLEAWSHGAVVSADLTLNPKPLRGVEVHLDTGCLPARLREAKAEGAAASPELLAFLKRSLGAAPALDEVNGHALVPATKVVEVEEGLRALGADVTYKRLAPANARHLEWAEQVPEDLHGARPRLREPFRGALAATPPGLRAGTVLAPYQKEAVAFIAHHDHTCLLADDMGLGKTLEAIAAAQLLPGRVLVVCPASAREVWRREVAKFTLESAMVLGPGADPALASGPEKYVVTGYSNLEALGDALHPEAIDLVILDESHYVKNGASGRSRAVTERLCVVPRRLVISGTPVMNTPDEIRSQLAFLHPDEWSDASWFKHRFVEPFEGGSPEVRDAVLRRLRQFLEGVMIRREKTTALPDLPSKSILWHRVKLAGEARRAYVALEAEFDDFVKAEGVASLNTAKATGKLERLKQAALAGKMPEAVRFLRELCAAGDKVVVFSRYRNPLASLSEELADLGAVVLSGDSSPEERAEAERRFQEDPSCRVFLGQLVAAGTALTLIAGTHAVFLDLDWNPANHRQAMDRIHRRGQTRPVTAHFFLAEETVDEDVAQVLDQKGRMMDALLAPQSVSQGELKGAKRLVGERLLARRRAPQPLP